MVKSSKKDSSISPADKLVESKKAIELTEKDLDQVSGGGSKGSGSWIEINSYQIKK